MANDLQQYTGRLDVDDESQVGCRVERLTFRFFPLSSANKTLFFLANDLL